MGNRMSSLPIAQFCAHGPRLSQMGSGRAAATSNCGHAKWAGDPKWQDLYARLTPDEQNEVDGWIKPATIVLDADSGVAFEYDAGEREIEVALNLDGEHCLADDPACISVGHIDCAQVCEYGGTRVALVVDLKRSEYTSSVDSLQLQAYLLAYASLHGCDMGCVGIWNLTDGEWMWGEMQDLGVFSDTAAAMRARVVQSALHTEGDYATGSHCRGCYGRDRCPAHLMPPDLAHTSLAPFCEPGGLATLDDDQRGQLLLDCKRAEDTIKRVQDACKAAQAQGLRFTDGSKEWRSVHSKGRVGFNSKALEADDPETFRKYVTIGKGFETYKWVNRK